jgi:hypothetical protein
MNEVGRLTPDHFFFFFFFAAFSSAPALPQHFLYFLPLPHGNGSFRPG